MADRDGAARLPTREVAPASRTTGDADRWRRLLALRDDQGHARGGLGPVPGRLRARLGRICGMSLTEVGADGAGITVMAGLEAGRIGRRDQLWATDPLARRLEDLQLTTGEGPCLDAYHLGAPVLVGDLDGETSRWLGFAPGALAAGAAAVFSLPLQVGAVRLGTLDMHRGTPAGLGREQLADALVLASMATETLLELAGDPDAPETEEGPGGWLPAVHADVHIASGMVSARQHVDVGTALLRLRGHAFAHDEPIDRVARRIIERDLVLDDPPRTDPAPRDVGADHDRDDHEDGPEGTATERDR